MNTPCYYVVKFMKSRAFSYSPCIRLVCDGDAVVGGVLVAGSLVSEEIDKSSVGLMTMIIGCNGK